MGSFNACLLSVPPVLSGEVLLLLRVLWRKRRSINPTNRAHRLYLYGLPVHNPAVIAGAPASGRAVEIVDLPRQHTGVHQCGQVFCNFGSKESMPILAG